MASTTLEISEASEARDSLFRCYELPATWALLRALSPPSSKLPDMDDIVQALRSPQGFDETIAGLHGRALSIPPSVARTEWISRVRELAAAYPSEFRLIFDAFSVENNYDSDEQGASVSDVEFAQLMSIRAYRALTAEQRLRILHTVAELTVQDPKRCGRLTCRAADEIRLGCLGHDSAGNDYYYFGDKQKLFREPGRLPRMRSFPPSLMYAEEERRKKERERVRKEAEIERRRQIKLELDKEKQKRAEERKRAADRRKREKEERARKREAEKERKAREMRAKWAPRDPNACVTRNSKRLKLKMEIEQNSAKDVVAPKKEEESELQHTANVNITDEMTQRKFLEIEEQKPYVGGTKAHKKQSTLDSFLFTNGDDSPPLMQPAMRKAQKLTPGQEVDEEAVSAGGTLASENGDVEIPQDTAEPRLRSCTGWELIADGFHELRDFSLRFGDPSKIKHPDERALLRRIRDVLLPEFEEEEAARARKILKRARMEKLAIGAKKSLRLREIDARKAFESEEARKLERRQRMRKKPRTK